MGVKYCTRGSVLTSTDAQIDSALRQRVDALSDASSRLIEGSDLTNRTFYPVIATKYFTWPNRRNPMAWQLWLDGLDLLTATTVTAGGVTIPVTDYFLEPWNDGPPYSCLEVNKATNSSFASGSTTQRAISVTGTWGYTQDVTSAGLLSTALASTTVTTLNTSDGCATDAGSTIRIDSEWMLVTDKLFRALTLYITNNLTATKSDVSVTLSGTTDVPAVGEVILVDSEQMRVSSVVGTTMTVRRAVNGSVLAAHTATVGGPLISVPRVLSVIRGTLGTAATTHLLSAEINVLRVPSPVSQLCTAMTLAGLALEVGMAQGTTGEGGTASKRSADQLNALKDTVINNYRRNSYGRAV
jgi:hypothetical protein